MQIHASCAARRGAGVLLLGPPGSGKSELVLRLLDHGFLLVADDRVEVADGHAWAPPALAGLLEVRGLGIIRLTHLDRARLALAVQLGGAVPRLPAPARHAATGLPLLAVDAARPAAAQVVGLALDCVLGIAQPLSGAFGADDAPGAFAAEEQR
ncbi:MAG: phosphotransferase [Acetobacteraceae bacterium]|nr:phosphotransferase [Acetobacteraceae bacterium]